MKTYIINFINSNIDEILLGFDGGICKLERRGEIIDVLRKTNSQNEFCYVATFNPIDLPKNKVADLIANIF